MPNLVGNTIFCERPEMVIKKRKKEQEKDAHTKHQSYNKKQNGIWKEVKLIA